MGQGQCPWLPYWPAPSEVQGPVSSAGTLEIPGVGPAPSVLHTCPRRPPRPASSGLRRNLLLGVGSATSCPPDDHTHCPNGALQRERATSVGWNWPGKAEHTIHPVLPLHGAQSGGCHLPNTPTAVAEEVHLTLTPSPPPGPQGPTRHLSCPAPDKGLLHVQKHPRVKDAGGHEGLQKQGKGGSLGPGRWCSGATLSPGQCGLQQDVSLSPISPAAWATVWPLLQGVSRKSGVSSDPGTGSRPRGRRGERRVCGHCKEPARLVCLLDKAQRSALLQKWLSWGTNK